MTIKPTIRTAASLASRQLARIPADFVHLTIRLGLAGIFWASARTKVTGALTISDSAYFLFEEEYRLPLLPVDIAVPLTTYAEHLLPILLFVGFATRLSALGLFIMTLVIQIFVYPSAFISTHLGWLAMALTVIRFGPGRWSIDYLLSRSSSTAPATKGIQ